MSKRGAAATNGAADAKKSKTDLPSSGHLAPHHLSSWTSESGELDEAGTNEFENPMAIRYPNMQFLNPTEKVMGNIITNDAKADMRSSALDDGCVRGNACRKIYFNPSKVTAALVTCGGLCPGLNSIIRGITSCLWFDYGVKNILGITSGYNGLVNPGKFEPIKLTPDFVSEIHMKGGSILKAGRGGFDAQKVHSIIIIKW